ncbi:hypothetical protein I545_0431 [Mycobacterium kansasii 662]|nr:hypothetical protein MKAN_21435 [Mycobacterium kansasii ATCC 12478]ARG76461.1 hypothetical protein B1T51_20555 [Mycobacterium kansasii]ARG81996.1 hypothetical protein B1T52_21000 [Mycobacterium kansasii]EUA21137.1 hypothetical protein I545_0431 [Mycobacterium kansasii 662]
MLAVTIKAGRFPSSSTLTALESSGGALAEQRRLLGAALDRHSHFRQRLQSALQGQAGDAALAAHDGNRKLWEAHEDLYGPAADAVTNAVGELRRLQTMLQDLIDDKEPAFQAALDRGDHVAAQSILAAAAGEADTIVDEHAANAEGHIKAVNFEAPLPLGPAPSEGPKPKPPGGKQKHDKWSGSSQPAEGSSAKWSEDGDAGLDGAAAEGNGGDQHDKWALTGPDPSPLTQGGKWGPSPNGPGMTPPLPASPLGSGGGSGGGGGRMPSLGSGSPSLASGFPSQLGSGTVPASAAPSAGAVSPASAAPLANSGSSFQSGLASGMGATSGMTASATPPAQPQQPMASTQPPVAAPSAAGPGMGPAGVGPGSGWTAQPVDSAGVSGGHGAGSAPIAGGGGMMPPPGMTASPLAPYSPPGAGAAGAGSGVPSSPTSPAGGSSTAGAGAGGGSGPTGGGPGAPPMLTGNPGSSGPMSALAGSSSDVNPDLVTAQRILGELAHGSEASKMLVLWAVVVLRSPVGTHIAVANNVGGGAYLPTTVYLPSTVRLAVSDPALPLGWADVWMGCQFPSKIVADYADRLTKVVADASVSALATTEMWTDPPHDFAGDFAAIDHRDALRLVNVAPKLDAAQQHRLAVIDPGLYQRVNGLDRGGNISAWAAATLTRIVFEEAMKPDDTGALLVEQADGQMLEAVSGGAATATMWGAYDRAAAQRHGGAAMWPDQHAPRDNDDSDVTRAITLWYTHYYRMGRMIELIQCWKAEPPRLAEIAYCGIRAGFGATVVTTIAAMEQHLAQERRRP